MTNTEDSRAYTAKHHMKKVCEALDAHEHVVLSIVESAWFNQDCPQKQIAHIGSHAAFKSGFLMGFLYANQAKESPNE